MGEAMTNEQCDVLIAVGAEPGRRMLLSDMTPRNQKIAREIAADGKHLILFVGDWVALTDAGYEASVNHCAMNF